MGQVAAAQRLARGGVSTARSERRIRAGATAQRTAVLHVGLRYAGYARGGLLCYQRLSWGRHATGAARRASHVSEVPRLRWMEA